MEAIQTLITYRQQIKDITAKFSDSDVSRNIEKMSVDVDQFIKNFQELEKVQKRFDKYLQGLQFSYSPEKSNGLYGSEPNLFEPKIK